MKKYNKSSDVAAYLFIRATKSLNFQNFQCGWNEKWKRKWQDRFHYNVNIRPGVKHDRH